MDVSLNSLLLKVSLYCHFGSGPDPWIIRIQEIPHVFSLSQGPYLVFPGSLICAFLQGFSLSKLCVYTSESGFILKLI